MTTPRSPIACHIIYSQCRSAGPTAEYMIFQLAWELGTIQLFRGLQFLVNSVLGCITLQARTWGFYPHPTPEPQLYRFEITRSYKSDFLGSREEILPECTRCISEHTRLHILGNPLWCHNEVSSATLLYPPIFITTGLFVDWRERRYIFSRFPYWRGFGEKCRSRDFDAFVFIFRFHIDTSFAMQLRQSSILYTR